MLVCIHVQAVQTGKAALKSLHSDEAVVSHQNNNDLFKPKCLEHVWTTTVVKAVSPEYGSPVDFIEVS